MLRLRRAEILEIAIPFRFGFRHALAERETGEGVLLVLEDGEGRRGFGECTPRAYVSGESSPSVVAALRRRLPELLGEGWPSFDAVAERVTADATALPRSEHAAFCALELALLDLAGKAFERCAGDLLGPVRDPVVAYAGVVSASGAEAAAKSCAKMKELGVTRAKVKVGGDEDEDLALLAVARETLGDDAELRADANGAWDARTALARLEAFERFRLAAIEQPCAAEDVQGAAWLVARTSVPVIADESLVSIADARRLADARACHVLNVRVSKCGGLASSGRIAALARERGLGVMVGAHVGETAILAAAGRQLAARTPDLRFAEGSYGALLLAADVSSAMDLGPGALGRVPLGPGLGIDVDLAPIEAHVRSRTMVDG